MVLWTSKSCVWFDALMQKKIAFVKHPTCYWSFHSNLKCFSIFAKGIGQHTRWDEGLASKICAKCLLLFCLKYCLPVTFMLHKGFWILNKKTAGHLNFFFFFLFPQRKGLEKESWMWRVIEAFLSLKVKRSVCRKDKRVYNLFLY